MAVIAGHEFRTPELILTGAGIALLMDSLLPWYGYDANGWHPTYTAFQSGFLAFFPLLLVVLVAGSAVTRAWAGQQPSRLGGTSLTWNAMYLVADAVALLLMILFVTTLPTLEGVSVGPKVGAFIGLVLTAVQGVGALLGMIADGTRLAFLAQLTKRASRPPTAAEPAGAEAAGVAPIEPATNVTPAPVQKPAPDATRTQKSPL